MSVFKFQLQRFAEKLVTLTEGDNNFTFAGNSEYNESTWKYDWDVKWVIHALGGDDTIKNNSSNNASVYGGAGNDSLVFAGSSSGVQGSSLLEGNDDDDTIESWNGVKNTLDGGNGNDSIANKVSYSQYDAQSSVIKGGAGNDDIYNQGYKATISGGAGEDTITSSGSNTSINGDAGNDLITLEEGSALSIKGGADDDTIFANNNSSNFFQYDLGDGNDTIIGTTNIVNAYGTNLNAHDTLEISSTKYYDSFIAKAGSKITGNTYIPTVISSDLILNVDTGTVNFKDIGNAGVNVIDSKDFNVSIFKTANGEGVYFLNDYAGTIIHGLKGNDTIKDVYDTSKSGKTDSIQVYTFDGDDVIQNENSHYATLDAGAGDDTIENSCKEVKIYTGDGNNRVKNSGNKASIVGGADSDTISNDMIMVTIRGGAGNDSIVNQGSLLRESTTKQSLLDGGDGDDYIANFYIVVPTDPTLPADNTTILGGAGNDTIFNDGNFNIIEGGAGNDIITLDENAQGNTIIHTPGDGNDSIYGFNATSILSITGATYTSIKSGDNLVFTVGEDKITLVDAASLSSVNVYGTAKTSTILTVSNSTASPVKADSTTLVIDASKRTKSVKILGNTLNNTISGGSGNDSILGGAGNDSISGGDGKDTLSGDAGNDKIFGGTGNDSISGGDGKDTLSGDAGNDKIFGGASNDSISGGDGKDTLSGDAGNDKIFGGTGNDSISGGDGKDTLSGDAGNDKIFGGASNDSVSGGDGKDTLSGDTGNDKIFGGASNDSISGGDGKDTLSGDTGNDKIFGGASNDSISGGDGKDTLSGDAGNDKIFGGKGNDSLWGGAGNDTLYGGDGKDTFIYRPGEGTNHIMDYTNGDLLKILKSNGKTGGSFTSSSFKNGNLTLSISGGGKVIFDDVSKSGTFNINSTTYRISGKKLVVS